MHFQIAGDERGTPIFEGDFERINVVLGTNGSGKSKLLDAIHLAATKQETGLEVVRVTASRQEDPPQNVSTRTQNGKLFDDFDEDVIKDFDYLQHTPEQIRQANEAAMPIVQETRLQQALKHFSTSLGGEKVEYRKRHYEWMATGGQTTPPNVPEDRDAEAHLDKLLSLFNEIFPEIKIKAKNFGYTEQVFVNQSQKTQRVILNPDLLKSPQVTGNYSFELTCLKNQQEYSPSALSEGEKQIFAMLADRYFYRQKKCLFLVDEPELNLDPVLAIKYWNLLEREMPDSVFVYTTHSLDFALRDSVKRIWSLGRGVAQQILLETLGTLPAEEQRRFLSGIRGIIKTNKGLVVEGKESSFDAMFYPWILGDQVNEFQMSYYEGCNDVRAATKKLDIWRQMVPTVTILGIVDADYRAQEELNQLAGTNCLCLGLHDAESFLCHPKLLVALAKELKRNSFPTQEALVDEICDFVQDTMVEICHHRMAQRCREDVAVSLRRNELAQVNTFEELVDKVCSSAIKQASSGIDFSEDHVKNILSEERRQCLKAKSEKNIDQMLNLVKGKKLVERFAKHFGLSNSLELMDYVSTNLSPTDFEHTRTLREQIESQFSSAGPTDGVSSTIAPNSAHSTPPTPIETNVADKSEPSPTSANKEG